MVLRPNVEFSRGAAWDPVKFREATRLFLDCAGKLGGSDLYRRDVIDILKQYMAQGDAYLLERVNRANKAGKDGERDRWAAEYLELIRDVDRVVATRPEYHLSCWLGMARKWGELSGNGDFYEYNARMQITLWGGTLPDYAWKEWSGLLSGFYAKLVGNGFRHDKNHEAVRCPKVPRSGDALGAGMEPDIGALQREPGGQRDQSCP